jgi:acyl carrier protein
MNADNRDRLEKIFREVFSLPADVDLDRVVQESDPDTEEGRWDSLGHVTLMAALEGEFGIAFDTSEMLELTSFESIRRFLEEKGL